jgi:hypothetical protein
VLDSAKALAGLPRTRAAWRRALSLKRPLERTQNIARSSARPLRARRERLEGDDAVNAAIPPARPRPAPILGFLATLLVFSAAIGAGLYQTDPSFAARINTITAQAQAQVSALARR